MSSTTTDVAKGKRSGFAKAARSSIVRHPRQVVADVARAEDVDGGRCLDRLDEHLHLAAADQPGLFREVVVQIVLDGLRLARLQHLPRLADGVVLVAAAADGADDAAVGKDQHLRADALRRRSRGRHDRDERHFFAPLQGIGQRGEDFVVHGNPVSSIQ
jgi:hypothetical protein